MLKKSQQLRIHRGQGEKVQRNRISLSEEVKDAINRYMPKLLISMSANGGKKEKNDNILSGEMKDAIDRFSKIAELKLAVKNAVQEIFKTEKKNIMESLGTGSKKNKKKIMEFSK